MVHQSGTQRLVKAALVLVILSANALMLQGTSSVPDTARAPMIISPVAMSSTGSQEDWFGLAVVRGVVPPGAPAQHANPLPPFRHEFVPECSPLAGAGAAHNLVRWRPADEDGLPDLGFDLYRCCGSPLFDGYVAPNGGDGVESHRTRAPRTNAEDMRWVTGSKPNQVFQPGVPKA